MLGSKTIYKGLAANSFGQVINICSQIVLVPVLLHAWGTEKFADWVLISTIPSYLAILDGGIGAVAGNQMTFLNATGMKDEARSIADSSLFAITISILFFLPVIILIFSAVPINYLLNMGQTTNHQAQLILILLSLSTFIGLWLGVFNGILKSENYYATSIVIGNFSRLFEAISCGSIALYSKEIIPSVLSMLLVKSLFALITIVTCKIKIGWLPTIHKGKWETIKPLLPAAIAQITMPLSYAFSLQGVVIAISHAAGPQAAASFNSMRIISRSICQATTIIGNSISPELTRMVGNEKYKDAISLLFKSTKMAMFMAFGLGLILWPLGNKIFSIWTKGKLDFNFELWTMLILTAIIYSLWNTLSYLPISINKHAKISAAFITTSIALPPLTYLGTVYLGNGFSCAPSLIGEVVLLAVVLNWIHSWSKTHTTNR